jgi:hypothetical protein
MPFNLPSDNLTEQGTNEHCTVFLKALTVGFTRVAGLVKEPPPQHPLTARVVADFERR